MPINPHSRFLPLMEALHNTAKETESVCVEAIRTIIESSVVCILFSAISVALMKKFLLFIPLLVWLGVCIYMILREIPYQFNIGEIREAIEGDTFSVLEVNSELVTLWMGKCNQCLGRAIFIKRMGWPSSIFLAFIFIFASLFA